MHAPTHAPTHASTHACMTGASPSCTHLPTYLLTHLPTYRCISLLYDASLVRNPAEDDGAFYQMMTDIGGGGAQHAEARARAMHTCTHAHSDRLGPSPWRHSCMHACTHAYIQAYIHACIHTGMHARMHTYRHTCTHAYMHPGACDRLSPRRSALRPLCACCQGRSRRVRCIHVHACMHAVRGCSNMHACTCSHACTHASQGRSRRVL